MSEQLIYGIHAVSAILNSQNRIIKKIIINKERNDIRLQDIIKLASHRNIIIEELSSHELSSMFPEVVHQGVVLYAAPNKQYCEQDIPSLMEGVTGNALILILDGVTDPHNLGACLRVADAAGVNFVVIPKDKNASITPVVSKVACGAAEFMPIVRVTNLARSIQVLKDLGVWIYGTDATASNSLYKLDCKVSTAFIMGSEGFGMRRLTRDSCDALCILPMLGSVSSLNVSVATGICLYEANRQRFEK